jgi:hypothetical protein
MTILHDLYMEMGGNKDDNKNEMMLEELINDFMREHA